MGAGNGLEGLSSSLRLLKREGINDQPWEPDTRTWRDRCSPLYNIFFFILFRAITSIVTGAFFESHLQTGSGLCWSLESCSCLPHKVHTHTHTHRVKHSHTHSHTHTHAHTRAHTHALTHTLSQQSHTHSHTHIHTNTHSHTHTLSHTHTHTHTCTRPTEEWGQPGSQPTLAAREDTGCSQQVTFSPEGRPSVSGSQPTGLRTCAHSFTAKEAGKVSVCFPSFSIGRWTLPPLIR